MKAMIRSCALHLGQSKGIDFIDAFYARGPTTLWELPHFIGLCFIFWRGNKLSPFASTPTGVPSIVPGQ
jgi:hypothetical protein